MQSYSLHIPETAGWRALVTEAQLAANTFLPQQVEDYLVWMLLHHLGGPAANSSNYSEDFLRRLTENGLDASKDLNIMGDQCLIFAGLFPEHAIRKEVPLAYFVEFGRSAYFGYADRAESILHREMGDYFVDIMDVLHTLRELSNGEPCIDGLNAFQLWSETGSHHAWQVLQNLSPGFPGAQTNIAVH